MGFGIYHSGIEVYGKEISFGYSDDGVAVHSCVCTHTQAYRYMYRYVYIIYVSVYTNTHLLGTLCSVYIIVISKIYLKKEDL